MKKLTTKQALAITVITAITFTLLTNPSIPVDTAHAQAMAIRDPANGVTSVLEPFKNHTQTYISYGILAKLNTENRAITGNQTVTYRNTSSDQLDEAVFYLQSKRSSEDVAGRVEVISVKNAATGRNLVTTNETQTVTVKLDKVLNKDEEVTLQVEFKKKLPFSSENSTIEGEDWFPLISAYNEKTHAWNKAPYNYSETDDYRAADYKIQLDVPKEWQVVMPGQMSEQLTEAGRKLVKINIDKERHVVFFASKNFRKASKTENGLTVEYMYYNKNNDPAKTKQINRYIEQAFKVLKFCNEKFEPYGYPALRIVESGRMSEGGESLSLGLIEMGTMFMGMIDPLKDKIFVHEIMHQWWGVKIGGNNQTAAFLSEGFADFFTYYFFHEQGVKGMGLDYLQSIGDDAVNMPINSSKAERGPEVNSKKLSYKRGAVFMYELYRTVGQKKFDTFMKEYSKRHAYRMATTEDLLQTIGDQFGQAICSQMDNNLNKPNYKLKPEYGMTKEERQQFEKWPTDEQSLMVNSLASIEQKVPNLPKTTMFKIVTKALRGEPITIVYSDPVSEMDKQQQQMVFSRLQETYGINQFQVDILSNKQMTAKDMKSKLVNRNVIIIGNPKHNRFIQAVKPTLVKKAQKAGFPWQEVMNKPNLHGAYAVEHPDNKDRLVLHIFWTDKHLSEKAVKSFPRAEEMFFGPNGHLQFFVKKEDGSMYKRKVHKRRR